MLFNFSIMLRYHRCFCANVVRLSQISSDFARQTLIWRNVSKIVVPVQGLKANKLAKYRWLMLDLGLIMLRFCKMRTRMTCVTRIT